MENVLNYQNVWQTPLFTKAVIGGISKQNSDLKILNVFNWCQIHIICIYFITSLARLWLNYKSVNKQCYHQTRAPYLPLHLEVTLSLFLFCIFFLRMQIVQFSSIWLLPSTKTHLASLRLPDPTVKQSRNGWRTGEQSFLIFLSNTEICWFQYLQSVKTISSFVRKSSEINIFPINN